MCGSRPKCISQEILIDAATAILDLDGTLLLVSHHPAVSCHEKEKSNL
jgi:hypothetical protein